MRDLNASLKAIIEAAAEAIVAGVDAIIDDQTAIREEGVELKAKAATHDLLGPTLAQFAGTLVGEVEREATIRFKAVLAHPRRRREQLIDELEDAGVWVNRAIAAMGQPPTASQTLAYTLAVVKVRAITAVLDGKAFVDPSQGRRYGGPAPRRRTVSAADIPAAVAERLLALADLGDDWRSGLDGLAELEPTEANRAGLVTKLLVLFDQPDGEAHLRLVVKRLGGSMQRAAQTEAAAYAALSRPGAHHGSLAGSATPQRSSLGERSLLPNRPAGGIAARLQANRSEAGRTDA